LTAFIGGGGALPIIIVEEYFVLEKRRVGLHMMRPFMEGFGSNFSSPNTLGMVILKTLNMVRTK